MARQILDTEALENIWDEIVYSHARLLHDDDAKDLAPPFKNLIERIEEAWKEQRRVWREETESQAHVDTINYRTDQRTLDFAFALEGANRKHPQGEQRQQRYFPIAPSKVVALALERQMPYTESFANSLPKEPESELQQFASGFMQDVSEGKAAITHKQKCADERRDNRVRVISALIDKINQVRESTYAELLKRKSAKHKSKDWPDSFFRRQKRNTAHDRDIEQKQQAILGIFTARGIEVSSETQKQITKETNPETLLRWLTKAVTAGTAPEALLD